MKIIINEISDLNNPSNFGLSDDGDFSTKSVDGSSVGIGLSTSFPLIYDDMNLVKINHMKKFIYDLIRKGIKLFIKGEIISKKYNKYNKVLYYERGQHLTFLFQSKITNPKRVNAESKSKMPTTFIRKEQPKKGRFLKR